MWNDLMELAIVPVVEDADLADVFQRMGKSDSARS
jgi:hypothetical protein